MRYNLLGQGGHWFAGQSLGNLTREEIFPSLAGCPAPETTLEHLCAARELLAGQKIERLSKSA